MLSLRFNVKFWILPNPQVQPLAHIFHQRLHCSRHWCARVGVQRYQHRIQWGQCHAHQRWSPKTTKNNKNYSKKYCKKTIFIFTLAPIWFPHCPAWIWTISLIFQLTQMIVASLLNVSCHIKSHSVNDEVRGLTNAAAWESRRTWGWTTHPQVVPKSSWKAGRVGQFNV